MGDLILRYLIFYVVHLLFIIISGALVAIDFKRAVIDVYFTVELFLFFKEEKVYPHMVQFIMLSSMGLNNLSSQ